jgi:outer membrane protein
MIVWVWVLLIGAAPVLGADVAKIAVIDFQKILDVSDEGKAAQTEINNKGKQWEQTLQQKGQDIEAARANFERESMVMSKEQRMDKEREIRIRINDFKQLQQEYAQAARKMQFELVAKIREKIEKIVIETGKKEGYLMILEQKEAGVIYAPQTIDITDDVIKRYNAEYAKTGGKS